MELFDYIDRIQAQIENIQEIFYNEWDQRIRSHFSLSDDFSIRSYVDIMGGYILNKAQYKSMDGELMRFYQQRILNTDESCYLRGYDYYSIDPLIHLQRNRTNPQKFWDIFQKKLVSYGSGFTFSFLGHQVVSFVNWIGTLGFLEYIFTDITSLMWFVYRNAEDIVFKTSSSKVTLNKKLRNSAQIIGECIAALLMFDYQHAYRLLHENVDQIINLDISTYLDLTNCRVRNWVALRSIREGDSLVLVYGAYLMKLSPCLKAHSFKKIILLSNCFGAMNVGFILKPLIAYEHRTDCAVHNILYAQNRAEEDEIYGGDCSQNCCFIDSTAVTTKGVQAVFVIDDSIFSGRSYDEIAKYLQEHVIDESCATYLLPMTLNCDCIKYCRRGIPPGEDMNQIAMRVIDSAQCVGNILPPFTSFWDFSRQAPENQFHTENAEVRSVLRGDDLLMKHLWARYEKEILLE